MSSEKTRIEICHGPRCAGYGGQVLLSELKALGIHAISGDCQSLCPYSPVAHVEGGFIPRATTQQIMDKIQAKEKIRSISSS